MLILQTTLFRIDINTLLLRYSDFILSYLYSLKLSYDIFAPSKFSKKSNISVDLIFIKYKQFVNNLNLYPYKIPF